MDLGLNLLRDSVKPLNDYGFFVCDMEPEGYGNLARNFFKNPGFAFII